jgi:hypothetical protein
MPKQLPFSILRLIMSKPRQKLLKELEDLGIDKWVALELVRASHPKAIKKWIALIRKNRK